MPGRWRFLFWLALLGGCRAVPRAADSGAPADVGPRPDIVSPADVLSVDAAPDLPPPATGEPCGEPTHLGWRCLAGVAVDSPAHGRSLTMALRWNGPQQEPAATVLWISGEGGRSVRATTAAGTVQDRMLLVDGIRSVEVSLGGAQGMLEQPRPGLPALGALLGRAIENIARLGLGRGKWLTLVAEGLTASAAAAGLARHRLGEKLDRLILVGGPAMTDIGLECGDPSHWTFIGEQASVRELVDRVNGWEQDPICGVSQPPGAVYEGRSVLGTGAEQVYPSVALTVLVGAAEPLAPWLARSNQAWFEQIAGQRKSRHVFAGVSTVVGDGPGVPADELQAALDALYAYGRTRPPAVAFSKPLLIYSKTKDGPPASQFAPDEQIFARAANIGPKARGCTELQSGRGACAELAGWTAMPNAEWSYDAASRTWRAQFTPASMGAKAGAIFYSWFRDDETAQHSDRATLKVF